MKVILLKKIPGIGNEGEVKSVSDGYARNFLLPKKLARVATEGIIKDFTVGQERQAAKVQALKAQSESQAAKIEGQAFEVSARAKGDKLYGSITEKKVKEALVAKFPDIQLEKVITHHIKTIGEHPLEVIVAGGSIAHIKLIVNGNE